MIINPTVLMACLMFFIRSMWARRVMSIIGAQQTKEDGGSGFRIAPIQVSQSKLAVSRKRTTTQIIIGWDRRRADICVFHN